MKQAIAALAAGITAVTVFGTPEVGCQQVWEGTIEGYTGSPGQVFVGLSPGMEPRDIGNVSASGDFVVTLEEDLIDRLETANEAGSQSGEWTSQAMTVAQVFSCASNESEIVGGELPVISLADYGTFSVANMEEEVLHGAFMAASSPAFAEAFNSFGTVDATPGYFLDWFYFDSPVEVRGSCTTTVLARNQQDSYERVTSYELDMKAGWNLVKYEIREVYHDPDGADAAARVYWVSMDTPPTDVKYVLVPTG